MKTFLIETAKKLGSFLWKLMIWLKNAVIKILNTRRLRNRVGMVIVLLLTWFLGVRYGANHVEIPEPEPQIVTVYATPDPEAQEFMNRYQQERTERENNLNLIAKVLYGYRNNSDMDLEGVVWVILNRVSNQAEFQNILTIAQACRQPHQWMGFEESNPVLDRLYEIADKVLTKYETDGSRPFGREYLYFEWSKEYITFKTELYDSPTCRKQRFY